MFGFGTRDVEKVGAHTRMLDAVQPEPMAPRSSARHVVSSESLHLATRRPAGRQSVVLLAEDDQQVREAIRMLIELQGCTVIEAADGSQAVAFATAFAGPIDLLVADVLMPGLPGPAVCDTIRRQRPNLPTLFVSACDPAEAFKGSAMPDTAAYLQKPFTPSQFAEVFERLRGSDGPRRVA